MSIIEVTSTLTHRSLMHKSKHELAQMVLELCDQQEKDYQFGKAKEREVAELTKYIANLRVLIPMEFDGNLLAVSISRLVRAYNKLQDSNIKNQTKGATQ